MPPYHIQSVNTNFYVLSKFEDKPGQLVDTQDGKDTIPAESVVLIDIPIGVPVIASDIRGVRGENPLFIALEGVEENTKLTWSERPFIWIIRRTGAGSYVITPQPPLDLYWFDEFNVGVGDHVAVRAGRNVRPPQNEWSITPA